MTKTPARWANNNIKVPVRVTPVPKTPSGWVNNVTKNLTQFSVTPKNPDAWGHQTALQTYFYNDRFTYNDPLVTYNFILNTNTANQLGQTVWSPA